MSGPSCGPVDLSIMGNTTRILDGIAMSSVIHRAPPQRPVDDIALALTSRSMGTLIDEQASLTATFTAAYGTAGGGINVKQRDVQVEKSANDVVRAEYVPKVRTTVRALQETLRLKREAAANPNLNPNAAGARAQLNARQQVAAVRLQAAARMHSARRTCSMPTSCVQKRLETLES